jgi:hypothetical protein
MMPRNHALELIHLGALCALVGLVAFIVHTAGV